MDELDRRADIYVRKASDFFVKYEGKRASFADIMAYANLLATVDLLMTLEGR